jgi:cell division protein ZapA (FtsZ GTPase activity inhibitor)
MNKYTVTVLGKPYTVKTDRDEEHVRTIERLLNGYIERFNPEGKIVNYLDLVVLSSLAMADELLGETLKGRDEVTIAKGKIADLIARIDRLS